MVNTQSFVERCFLGKATADGGIFMISTLIFQTTCLDSHVIIFNKEALLDVYLQFE